MKKALAKAPAPAERERVDRIVQAALDTKALDVIVYDMEQRSAITDYLVICSGLSQAHVRGIAERIEADLRTLDVRAQASEGYQEGSWVLLDYDVALVHVFHPETRTYYDLESLLSSFPHERV